MHSDPARGRVGCFAGDALTPPCRPNIECAVVLKQLPRRALTFRRVEVIARRRKPSVKSASPDPENCPA